MTVPASGATGAPRTAVTAPELWLVRHGETEWARDGRHTGRTDIGLTDRGREQARALGDRLAGERFAAVRCSPLSRARETLGLAVPGAEPQLDADLAERDYGSAEGRTTDDLRAEQPGWTSWTTPTPGAETIEAVGLRADRAIARAVAAGHCGTADDDQAPGATSALPVLVVAHGHLLRILAARWLGQPAVFGAHLVLGTASLSVLGTERGRPALLRWNT